MSLFITALTISVIAAGSAAAVAVSGGNIEILGWSAAALTVLTFAMRSMVALRLAALAANVCFIIYAAHMALMPVLALHLLLVPCNAFRLGELVVELKRSRATAFDATSIRTNR
jgi:hypothetical protein